MRLSSKTIAVTGAQQGIGAASMAGVFADERAYSCDARQLVVLTKDDWF